MKKEVLKKLLEFSTLLNSSLSMEEVKNKAIHICMDLLGCEAGSLLLYDEEAQELYFDVALGEKGEKVKTIRLKLGEGIAGWVAQHRKPEIVNNVQKDLRFFRKADMISNFTTRNMVCVPIIFKEKLLGVLQLINKKKGMFNKKDLELIQILASQIAVSLENARLYEELCQTLHNIVQSI